MKPAPIKNRVTEMAGVDYPILQAPMGWIARAQLASAVSNAGAMGIIETSSGDFDAIKGEVAKMHEMTDKPFGQSDRHQRDCALHHGDHKHGLLDFDWSSTLFSRL